MSRPAGGPPPATTTIIPGARNREQAEAHTAAGLLPLLSDAGRHPVDPIVPPGDGREVWPARAT